MNAIWIVASFLILPAPPQPAKIQPRVSFSHDKPIHCVAFASDDQLLSGGGWFYGPGEVLCWELSKRNKKAAPRAHALAIWCLSDCAQGDTFVSGGGKGEVVYWRKNDMEKLFLLHDSGSEYVYRIVGLGRRDAYAWCGDKILVAYDFKQRKKLFEVKDLKSNAVRHIHYVQEKEWLVVLTRGK